MTRLPTNRPPTHPGEMLLKEVLKPSGTTQAAFAKRLGIPSRRLNKIIHAKRAVTPDIAQRLSRVLDITPDFWLGLQEAWDLWHARRQPQK